MKSTWRGKYWASGRPLTWMFPVPGFMRTRAIAVLRRPVVVMMGTSGKLELLRLLRGVGMRGPGVHLELAQELPPQRVRGQHAAHGMAHHPVRVRPVEDLSSGGGAQVPRVARV